MQYLLWWGGGLKIKDWQYPYPNFLLNISKHTKKNIQTHNNSRKFLVDFDTTNPQSEDIPELPDHGDGDQKV